MTLTLDLLQTLSLAAIVYFVGIALRLVLAGGKYLPPEALAPVAGSVKIRGWLTMLAVSGAASGTLMTSMRHWVGLPVVTGAVVSAAFPVSGFVSQPATA